MKVTNLGVIVATRALSLAGKPRVTVVLGKPEPFPDHTGFYRPFRITGLGSDSIRYAGGEDAVQALTLTLRMIGSLLYTSSEAKTGLLTWDAAPTPGDLGFPRP